MNDYSIWRRMLRRLKRKAPQLAPIGTIEIEVTKLTGGPNGFVGFTLIYRSMDGSIVKEDPKTLDRYDSLRVPWVTLIEGGS